MNVIYTVTVTVPKPVPDYIDTHYLKDLATRLLDSNQEKFVAITGKDFFKFQETVFLYIYKRLLKEHIGTNQQTK